MTTNKPRRAGARPIPADAHEAEILAVWATSPNVTEAGLVESLPHMQFNPRMQAVLDRAIEQRRKREGRRLA